MPAMNAVSRVVTGWNGVRLAVQTRCAERSRVHAIVSHGLGCPRPTERHALNDPYTEVAMKGCDMSGVGWTAQDVRGHGASGWDGAGDWATLGRDVLEVVAAEAPEVADVVVLAGQSMGAVASLEAAVMAPTRVQGLVLMRLPAMWATRANSAAALRAVAAEELTDRPEDTQDRSVLLAAAATDLSFPPSAINALAAIPTLILAVENDGSHPVSSAEAVKAQHQGATLIVSTSEEAAFQEWPALVAAFVAKLRS